MINFELSIWEKLWALSKKKLVSVSFIFSCDRGTFCLCFKFLLLKQSRGDSVSGFCYSNRVFFSLLKQLLALLAEFNCSSPYKAEYTIATSATSMTWRQQVTWRPLAQRILLSLTGGWKIKSSNEITNTSFLFFY